MKYCTNKKCPALHCARQMISPSDATGAIEFEFETSEDIDESSLVAVVDGKQLAFHCEGRLYGVIA